MQCPAVVEMLPIEQAGNLCFYYRDNALNSALQHCNTIAITTKQHNATL